MQWIRRRGGVGWTIMIPLVGLLLARVAWPLLVMPQIALLMPALVCWAERRAGMLSAVGLMATLCLAFFGALGPMAALLALLLLAPVFIVSYCQYQRDGAFWTSVTACGSILLITATGIVLALWVALDENPVTQLILTVEAWLEETPYKSDVLVAAWQYGLARVSDASTLYAQSGESIVLTSALEKELTQTLLTSLEATVRNQLPRQIIIGGMLGGVLSVALPRWEAARDMDALHPPEAPPLHTWCLPNSLLLRGVVLLLALLVMSTGLSSMAMAVHLVWTMISCALSLQGIAVLDFFLRKRNVRRATRTAASAAAFLLLRSACVFLGAADALFGLRGTPPNGQRTLISRILPKDEEDE